APWRGSWACHTASSLSPICWEPSSMLPAPSSPATGSATASATTSRSSAGWRAASSAWPWPPCSPRSLSYGSGGSVAPGEPPAELGHERVGALRRERDQSTARAQPHEVRGVGDEEIVPARARVPAEPVRAEEAVEADAAEPSHRARLPIDGGDGGIRDHAPEPASLEPHPALVQRVAGGRQSLDHPERAEERQGQDDEERIAAGGDEDDAEGKGHPEAHADAADSGQPALAHAQDGGEELVGHADFTIARRVRIIPACASFRGPASCSSARPAPLRRQLRPTRRKS